MLALPVILYGRHLQMKLKLKELLARQESRTSTVAKTLVQEALQQNLRKLNPRGKNQRLTKGQDPVFCVKPFMILMTASHSRKNLYLRKVFYQR